jgi:aminoglycoside phosphotransferase (APT) family kinase protein
MNTFPQNLKLISEALNLNIENWAVIAHKDTISSQVFRLQLQNGAELIAKFPHSSKRWKRETFFLDHLQKILPVAKLQDVIEPSDNFAGAIIMKSIPGALASKESLSQKQAQQMGECLGKLHTLPATHYGDIAQPEKELVTANATIKESFESAYKECTGTLPEKLLSQIESLFYKKLEAIKTFDGPCIVHKDFRPGNVIFQDDRIGGILDFESSLFSFAEEDFAQMEHLVWSTHTATKQSFLDGYQSIRSLPNISAIMPLLRLNKAIGGVGFTIARNTYKDKHQYIFDMNMLYIKTLLKKAIS